MTRAHQKILALTLGATVFGSSTALAAETLKIAIAGPFTGPVAQYGDMQKIGAEMAVERINAAGGVDGMMLEAVLMDDVCEPKQAVAVANKVINDDIQFVVGHLCSGSTQPASEVYEDEGVLMITPASTNPAITERGFELIFRTIGLDSQQGPVAGTFIAEKMKPTKMAIIHDKQQYGQGIAQSVKDTVEKAGVDVAVFEGVNSGQNDFSALITKLKRDGIDFVYYGGYHPELGLILRQSKEQGFDARFMGPEGVGNQEISAIAGDASEGLLVTLPADFAAEPANADLVQAFKDKGQDPSGPFVMPSYAAVQVVTDAIKATGSTDPETVAAAMRETTYQTPIGSVAFDEKGDLREFQFVVYEWHTDGSKTVVE
jgi:branched-chain amino acid transport system substrate-binding protein